MKINNVKVLVVDPSAQKRAELIEILELLGFSNIHKCDNGADALKQMKNSANWGEPFHLLFTELYLPKTNAISIIKELRSMEIYKKIPIFLISEAVEKEILINAFLVGATEFITKPIEPNKDFEKIYNKLVSLNFPLS